MRIAFVSRRFLPTISGMSTYALNLVRQLAARGHEIVLFAQYRDDPAGKAVYGGGPPPTVAGVDVRGAPSVGELDGGDFERDVDDLVTRVVAANTEAPFDVVHAQYGYPPGLVALEVSRRLGIPSVVSVQGGDGHWVGTCCGTHRRAMDAVLAHAGAVVVGSRSFGETVQATHAVPAEWLTVVPGGTDTERFHPAPPRPRSQPPVLLAHGRVDARKGALDLLDAVDLLPAGTLRLVVSGVGPDLEAARARATTMAGPVDFTGWVAYSDAPTVYRQADLFASPTYAEGFSNTILEAMASGLPIVSTAATGVVDCLRHDENALLVEPGDVRGLSKALERLVDDPTLARRLSEVALDEVRERYSWPAVAAQIEGLYDELRGTAPDDGWTLDRTVESCRFRAAPHLL